MRPSLIFGLILATIHSFVACDHPYLASPSLQHEPYCQPGTADFARHVMQWSNHKGPIGPQDLNFFITHIYNSPLYVQDYLPNDLSDMLRFLRYGNQTYKNRTYVQQVIRLSNNKLKRCHYLNPEAFSQLLDELPNLLERHCVPQKIFTFDLVQQQVNKSIEKYVQSHAMQSLQTRDMVDTLSKDIAQALDTYSAQQSTSVDELRKTIQIFCEISISKLIWAPQDGITSWAWVKKISQQLTRLHEASLMNDTDDLNDLFISLIERYCYFVELMAQDFTPEFYTALREELQRTTPAVLDFQEQEPTLETKRMRLLCTLDYAESLNTTTYAHKQLFANAQQIASEHGIIMQ